MVLEDQRTPRLFISDYYRRRLMSGKATPDERAFIKRKMNAAQWLIDSIEQRRSTLDQGRAGNRRLSEAILRRWT